MARKAQVLTALDVMIRRLADNENISADERIRLINELLDMRIAMNSTDTGQPETRATQ